MINVTPGYTWDCKDFSAWLSRLQPIHAVLPVHICLHGPLWSPNNWPLSKTLRRLEDLSLGGIEYRHPVPFLPWHG